ncbi:unnamed protein product [Sphagnum troendelagicum]
MVQCSDAEGGAPPMGRESKKAKRDLEDMTKEKSQEWTDSSITALLDIYEEKWNYLKRGNLRSRDWSELALQVSARCHGPKAVKTASQCKNKIESMKKKYRAEKQSRNSTGTAPRWKFFTCLDTMLSGAPPPLKVLSVPPAPPPPDLGCQPAVVDIDSREGLAQVESGDSGAQECPTHVLVAPCLTNMAQSNAAHNASCCLVRARKSTVHASVAIIVSRQTSVQPLEETVTISTDQEFQEFLENEDSFLFDETNKKVVHFMSLRNNRHYHLEQKPGKVITLRSPSRLPPTFLRVKLRNTKEFDTFLRSMGFVGLLPFPSNKDMDSLVLKYSELVDGSICVGYKPGRLPFLDDFQDDEKDRIQQQ